MVYDKKGPNDKVIHHLDSIKVRPYRHPFRFEIPRRKIDYLIHNPNVTERNEETPTKYLRFVVSYSCTNRKGVIFRQTPSVVCRKIRVSTCNESSVLPYTRSFIEYESVIIVQFKSLSSRFIWNHIGEDTDRLILT